MFCFNFSTQDKKVTLTAEGNEEAAFITKGFESWKKAPKCFEEHPQRKCHKSPIVYHVVPNCNCIAELTRENLTAK